MSDVKPVKLSWLWPGRIPYGKVSVLVGDPSLGKSLLTVDFAARVSQGRGWPDALDKGQTRGDVLMMSAEDGLEDTIVPRLMAQGADLTRVHTIQTVRGENGQPKPFCIGDVDTLRLVAQAVPDLRLVCVDPVSAFLGNVDSHNNAEVRSLMAPLAAFASEFDVAVLAVTHSNKSSAQKAMYRIVGSLAFVAAARACWAVVKDPKDPDRRGFLPIKNNLGKDGGGLVYHISTTRVEKLGPQPVVIWEQGETSATADEWMAAEQNAVAAERDTVGEWLNEVLEGGERRTQDVREDARQAGLSWAAVRVAKERIGATACKRGAAGSAGHWVWRLPPEP